MKKTLLSYFAALTLLFAISLQPAYSFKTIEEIKTEFAIENYEKIENTACYILNKDNQKGFYCENIGIILRPLYDNLEYTNEYFITERNGKHGLYSIGEGGLLKPEYDEIKQTEETHRFIVRKGEKSSYYFPEKNVFAPMNFHYSIVEDTILPSIKIVESNGKIYVYDLAKEKTISKAYESIDKTSTDIIVLGSKNDKKELFDLSDKTVLSIEYPDYDIIQNQRNYNIAYYVNDEIIIKDFFAQEICRFKSPNTKVAKILDEKYVVIENNGKYGWFDIKKQTLSKDFYDDVKTEAGNWFSPLTSRSEIVFYEKDGIWHNSENPSLAIKRTLLAPIEIPIALTHDILDAVIMPIIVFPFGYWLGNSPYDYVDWWLKKECKKKN